MNELALFTGAGGGLLATKLLGFRTICGVEIDEYAASLLAQRQNDGIFSPFPIWNDIRTFDGKPWRGIVDLVSGGFPCQAYSTAASGKNNADDLWQEMRRIVADAAPRYVFAENVSKKAIEAAADDLEQMGYKTKALALSAQDLGADHIRQRYWLFAYTDDQGELLRHIHAKTSMRRELSHSVWGSYPDESRVANGLAFRVDRLKASGNGQVSIVAYEALISLIMEH